MNNINIAWEASINILKQKIKKQPFNTWIKPLTIKTDKNNSLIVIAPNQFVLNWVKKNFIDDIKQLLIDEGINKPNIRLGLNSDLEEGKERKIIVNKKEYKDSSELSESEPKEKIVTKVKNKIKPDHTFENFIEGKSNQLGKAAALQIANNIGGAYNPFFMYGGVGLGKTHLMQAIGNHLLEKNPKANVVYLHSERFVADMVKALQHNSMNKFKQYYRTADILLIDDIQFFARKERTQEEFFHTFNALLEGQKQIVLTCDKYPKEISGLEDRLKSRFGWGLTVAIEPPELETRVAILKSKAEHVGVNISDDVAFFIARKISSNVRELEGALRRVMAQANFTGSAITVEFVKQALRDLFAAHDRMINIDNIQKTVAEYYHIRVSDLHSKSRIRSIARPRQMAMTLAKELTNHSLPEIGKSFGGRDHTTVLHACRKIKELRESDSRLSNDYLKILNILNS